MNGSVWVRIADFPDYAVSGEGKVMRLTPRTQEYFKKALSYREGNTQIVPLSTPTCDDNVNTSSHDDKVIQ